MFMIESLFETEFEHLFHIAKCRDNIYTPSVFFLKASNVSVVVNTVSLWNGIAEQNMSFL